MRETRPPKYHFTGSSVEVSAEADSWAGSSA
jgi:hypothetical protein